MPIPILHTSFIKGNLKITIVIRILTLDSFSSVTASYTIYCAFDPLGLRPFAHPLIFSIMFDALHAKEKKKKEKLASHMWTPDWFHCLWSLPEAQI